MWRKAVRERKIHRAKAALAKHLYVLSGVFQERLISEHSSAYDMCETQMARLEEGTTYTLEQFTMEQSMQRAHVEAVLSEYADQTLRTVTSACTNALELLQVSSPPRLRRLFPAGAYQRKPRSSPAPASVHGKNHRHEFPRPSLLSAMVHTASRSCHRPVDARP